MRLALRDWVTVRNAAVAPDPWNPIVNWGTATEAVEPAQVRPATSDETVVNEDTVVDRWRIILLPGTVATYQSRIVWRGETFEVDGEVQPATDDRGRIRHYRALIKRVTV